MSKRFYRVTRDLHLYFGLFISPFVLIFAGVALAVTIAFSTVAVVSAVIFRRGRWKERPV